MSNNEASDEVETEVRSERAPFEMVPTELWMGGVKGGACSPNAVQAYILLRQSGADAGFSIKRKTLAAKVGKGVRTIDGWIDELIAQGWVLKTPRFRATGDEQQTSNAYLVLWDRITGADDPRYRKHLEEVAQFEREMEARKAARKAAATPRAGSCEGGSQDPARGPVQDPASQNPDSSSPDSSSQTRAAAEPQAREDGTGNLGLASVRDVPRETDTEPNDESATENGDGSAAPGRRLDRCTNPEHQAAAWPEACRGCMVARRAWLRSEEMRDSRIADALDALEHAPACSHGKPGGDQPHPADLDGPPLCPLCRTGAAADDGPATMTADDAARLRALLGTPDDSTAWGVTPSILEGSGARST